MILDISQTYYDMFNLYDDTGALANADATPTITVVLNGTDTAMVATLANPSTGIYAVSLALSFAAVGNQIYLRATGNIGTKPFAIHSPIINVSKVLEGVPFTSISFNNLTDIAAKTANLPTDPASQAHGDANWATAKGFATDAINDAVITDPTGDTTFTVAHGARFRVGDQVQVDGASEVMLVTGISGNDLTVTRGYAGTTAGAISDQQVLLLIQRQAVLAANQGSYAPAKVGAAMTLTADYDAAKGAAGANATADITGVKLAADGLDNIPVSAPTGPATTFAQMIVQTWRRYFAKSVYDASGNTLKTYADDGTTVVTTQTATNASGVYTQGKAT